MPLKLEPLSNDYYTSFYLGLVVPAIYNGKINNSFEWFRVRGTVRVRLE